MMTATSGRLCCRHSLPNCVGIESALGLRKQLFLVYFRCMLHSANVSVEAAYGNFMIFSTQKAGALGILVHQLSLSKYITLPGITVTQVFRFPNSKHAKLARTDATHSPFLLPAFLSANPCRHSPSSNCYTRQLYLCTPTLLKLPFHSPCFGSPIELNCLCSFILTL